VTQPRWWRDYIRALVDYDRRGCVELRTGVTVYADAATGGWDARALGRRG